jgi:Uma2 family endonuclease
MTPPCSIRKTVSVTDYLAREEKSRERHEYVAGELYAMAGASTRHNLIASNILRHLHSPARRRGCRVYMEGVKLRAAADIIYYPDVMIARDRAADDSVVVGEPSLIVEVSSPGTRATDRREKFAAYQRIASLQSYLIVEQNRRQVILYTRVSREEWERVDLFGTDSVVINVLEHTLGLDDIYEDVSLPPMQIGEELDDAFNDAFHEAGDEA